jgi:hypothetical protein
MLCRFPRNEVGQNIAKGCGYDLQYHPPLMRLCLQELPSLKKRHADNHPGLQHGFSSADEQMGSSPS